MNTNTSPWIRSPQYDLAFIFGGALLALALPLAATFSPALLVGVFFWAWVFFFEGSHFWATYSRTYMDAKFRRENGGVLTFSLIFLVLPLLMVIGSEASHSPLLLNLYGFFIFTWSLYHNTRQHYGFVAIYNGKRGLDPRTKEAYKWGVYLATLGPMSHFFLSFKMKGDFPEFFSSLVSLQWVSGLQQILPLSLVGLSIAYFLFLILDYRKSGKGSPIALGYILTCMVFYNVMFFAVAHMEPFLPNPQNLAQGLMIVTIMNSLFHNIQYHAIVWHYSGKRYKEEGDASYGLANRVNRYFPTYALAALGFSTLFTLVFWGRSEIPFLTGHLGTGGYLGLCYVLYFGVVGQHFYLDQKIWKVSRTRELSGYFSLLPFRTQSAATGN